MNNNKSFPSKLGNSNSQVSSSISKSKLNFIKNIRNFGSLLNNSTSYWQDAIDKSICNCSRDDTLIRKELEDKPQPVKGNTKPFKIVSSDKKMNYTKEWTKEEIDILIKNYYNLNIKNWKKLSEIIQTKSPQQCCYKIKKIEEKSKMRNFSRQDDIKLIEIVEKYGRNWEQIATFFPGYSPGHLEERYVNKLDPQLKRSKFTPEEDDKILSLYNQFGNNWKEIASHFPDRNANMIKNRFYSFLKKKNNIKGGSTYSNTSGPSSYAETTSILLSNNEILEEALNSADNLQFKYNNDIYDNVIKDTYPNSIDMKMNNLIIKEEDINNRNNEDVEMESFQNNTLDGFVETYQKIFPNQLKKEVDFDDSGSSNNIMIGSIKVSSNSDEDNESSNSKPVTNNTTVLKNSQIEQSQKLFNESKHLEEILKKIDLLQNKSQINTNYEQNKNNKEYIELINKKEKIIKYKNILNNKLQELKEEYQTKQNSNILIEINEILLKLIKVGKLDLMVSKSINEFGNNNDMCNINTKDIEFEIENV